MAFLFKPTTLAAVSMRPHAIRLANSLPDKEGMKHQILDGFILRAIGNGDTVIVTVIELGGLIGGAFGNLERRSSAFYPQLGKLVAMYSRVCPPISTTIGTNGVSSATAKPYRSYAVSGGVSMGGPIAWGSAHNIKPLTVPRSFPMASAVLFPAVAGLDESAVNRSVLIQRLNVATIWAETNGTLPAPASPYGLRLNKAAHDGRSAAIAHVELASASLDLGGYVLTSGGMACLEWGGAEGAVFFPTVTIAVNSGSAEFLSEGVPGDNAEGTYAVGHVLATSIGSRYTRYISGADADYALRCGRYSISAEDLPPDVDGEINQLHTPTIPWLSILNGAGAPAGLAHDTPPAATAERPVEVNGAMTSLPTNWKNLWGLRDVLVWSSHAGYAGMAGADGETIVGIGTALVRRFRTISRRKVSLGPYIANEPYLPRGLTVDVEPAIMTFLDRHTVRFSIDPASGAITYESLYQFVNCYSERANDCQYFQGVFAGGLSVESLGANATGSYDTDDLEGFTHTPLSGFTSVTPATEADEEQREVFIACSRIRTLYEVLPAAHDYPEFPALAGTNGVAILGPVYSGGGVLMAEEGEVWLFERPFDHWPGYPASFPYRVEKRNPTKAELIEGCRLVVIGQSGAEVVMNTGSFYPDFGSSLSVEARKEQSTNPTADYYPDRVDRGSPVCQYAPGIIAVVVIPGDDFPEPRPDWPWPPPHISPQVLHPLAVPYSYAGTGDYAAYDAWKAADDAQYAELPEEPITPAPLPQRRHIALCDARSGALIQVSAIPFHISTALQDTSYSTHRSASYALSCIELGEVDEEGALVRHGGLLISIREPVPAADVTVPTRILTTWDLGVTVKDIGENTYGVPMHYLGTASKPAEIGISTGVKAIRGKPKLLEP